MIKGLNCCAVFFKKLQDGNDFVGVFDKILPKYINGGIPAIDLCIAIFISGMFPRQDILIDTDFKRNCTYDVLVRLKHASFYTGVNLAQYSFSTNNTNEIEIFNNKRIIEIENCMLPSNYGEYRVMIFIKEHNNSVWLLQYENGFVVSIEM